METDNKHKYSQLKIPIVGVLILLVLAGLSGWWLAQSGQDKKDNKASTNSLNESNSVDATDPTGSDIRSLVSYKLPGGWRENTCPSTDEAYIAPTGTSVNCEMDPRSPVVISLDPAGATDCNQIQNVQNVSKHVCISEYINGKKALKAETIYSKDSIYGKETDIHAYYIDTGKGVVKVEYVHSPSDSEFLGGFEQLAKSVEVKG